MHGHLHAADGRRHDDVDVVAVRVLAGNGLCLAVRLHGGLHALGRYRGGELRREGGHVPHLGLLVLDIQDVIFLRVDVEDRREILVTRRRVGAHPEALNVGRALRAAGYAESLAGDRGLDGDVRVGSGADDDRERGGENPVDHGVNPSWKARKWYTGW